MHLEGDLQLIFICKSAEVESAFSPGQALPRASLVVPSRDLAIRFANPVASVLRLFRSAAQSEFCPHLPAGPDL